MNEKDPFSGEIINSDGLVGQGVKFERIRRITGYLVGGMDRFNDAKKAEVRDRVPHVGASPTHIKNQGA